MSEPQTSPPDNWQEILKGSDQDAFRELIEPLTDLLVRAARRDLDFYARQGMIQANDFSPEELVGEALLYAWWHRDVRPEQMSLFSWMLGTQHRVTRGLINRQRSYQREKRLSLDEPIPTDPDAQDTQEWFWDWYQPEQELTWEDVIPAQEPDEIEVTLSGEYEELLENSDSRHVLMLHDEFEMSLPEVAFTINRTPEEVADLLETARASLSKREPVEEDTEHPPHE